MLVIPVTLGETIYIGDVAVEVVTIGRVSYGNPELRVKLGITAHPDIPVHRIEVQRAIEANGACEDS